MSAGGGFYFMATFSMKIIGMDQFKKALERNPNKVKDELGKFFIKAIASYKSGIINNPWHMNANSGGSPVATGNLRDMHKSLIKPWQAVIGPDENEVRYAKYVHDGTKRMHARPWLDFVKKDRDQEVKKLEQQMLQNIVSDLAK